MKIRAFERVLEETDDIITGSQTAEAICTEPRAGR